MKQEGTRDLGHLDNMRPHNLLFTVYPNPFPFPSLHTNNLLHYFKYFIPLTLSFSLLHNTFFFLLQCLISVLSDFVFVLVIFSP